MLRLAIAVLLSALALATPAAAATGDLTQLADPFGCNHFATADATCTATTALKEPEAVTVSPDGKSVYAVAAYQGEATIHWVRDAATGSLSQPSDPTGCISETGSGPCRDGKGLVFPVAVAVSPDGKNVYVGAANSGTVTILDRDPASGLLTQRTSGVLGCVSANGNDFNDANVCKVAVGIDSPSAIVVSPDGKAVYEAGEKTIVALSRDPATGDLSALPAHGCLVDVNLPGTSPCDDARGIWDLDGLAISADGKSVLAASSGTDAPIDGGLAILDRDASTNILTERAGTSACFTENGSNGDCTSGRDADTSFGVAISPDDKTVYLATRRDSLLTFDRDSATGALTQKAGTAGCTTDNSFDATNATCALGHSLPGLTGVAVSPDGKSVYASSQDLGGVAIFDRDPATGVVTQRASPAGCVAAGGYFGQCASVHSMTHALGVAVSPDSRNVYVASQDDSVGVLARAGGGAVVTPSPSPSPAPGGTVAPSPSPSPSPAPVRLPPTFPPPRIVTVHISVRSGTATVDGEAPGPGVVTANANGSVTVHVRSARIAKTKVRTLKIARASKTVAAAGKVTLVLKPKGKAKKLLHKKGKLKATVRVTFVPTEGKTPAAATKKVTFKYKRR